MVGTSGGAGRGDRPRSSGRAAAPPCRRRSSTQAARQRQRPVGDQRRPARRPPRACVGAIVLQRGRPAPRCRRWSRSGTLPRLDSSMSAPVSVLNATSRPWIERVADVEAAHLVVADVIGAQRVVAHVARCDRVVLDLAAVDVAGGDAVGHAAQRHEQGDAGDHESGRRAPAQDGLHGNDSSGTSGTGFELGPEHASRRDRSAPARASPAGSVTTKRAPPPGRVEQLHAAAVGVGDRLARSRGPRPLPPARAVSPSPRAKRSKMRSRSSAGTPGPRSATSSTRRVAVAAHRDGHRRAGRRCGSARSRPGCRPAGAGRRRRPAIVTGAGQVERQRVVRTESAAASVGGLARDRGQVDAARAAPRGRRRRARAAAGRRPAAACASTSAAPTRPSRAARRPARPRAARGWRGCWSAACAARARRRRRSRAGARASPRSRRARRPARAASSSKRVGEVGDLVVGPRLGQRDLRVARARHLARGAGQPGDRAHRALGDVEAAEEREQRAAQHAEGEEQPHAVRPCGSRCAFGLAYWT